MQATNNDNSRSFVSEYTINTANTWEYKTIAFSGDTSGTWNTEDATGIRLQWPLHMGSDYHTSTLNSWIAGQKIASSSHVNLAATSGATWQIAGVQCELGDIATPFEHRSFADELIRCQRYYEKSYDIDVEPGTANEDGVFHWQSNGSGGSIASFPARFTVRKCKEPTITVYNPTTGSSGSLRCNNGTNQGGGSYGIGETGFNFRTSGSATTNDRYVAHYTAEAEL